MSTASFAAPTRWEDALAEKAARPDVVPIAGGTDLMVAVNRGQAEPAALLDLTRVEGLADWSRDGARLRIGAAVPYARLVRELAAAAPGLAAAARTVGSPQIRNRGTVGGNLASASPAGDCHPPLLAAGAVVELASVRGVRRLPVGELFTGVKRTVLAPDELIAAVDLPVARGPQEFAKVGTRNAMVIAVCSVAVALDPAAGTVGTGLGSVAPTPRRAVRAEVYVTGEIAELGLWDSRDELPDPVATRFGELVAAAAAPIDDVRGTAAYRRHALGVLGRRVLQRAWHGYRTGAP
ncbi:MAG TPA: FAD binding domain-containing protein [Mycobacteriales bacterium]|jgi:CO/xanthine dehydrogenase FAD-binding subunit|nr:FAD binding domain-containing protein [Mycobacteriales bacterium]